MRPGKIVTGLIIGAAAGAILGVLFAPDEGIKTRKKIARKGNDFKEELKEKFSDLIDTMSSRFQFPDLGKAKTSQTGKVKSLQEEEANGFI